MSKYKIESKLIGGKYYDMIFCLKCDVWIPKENFNLKTGEHTNCDEYQKSKEMKKRTANRVCNIFNKMLGDKK